jgi:hypothetical protein
MRAILFQVEGWKKIGDRVYVGGRNCGDALRIGDEFSGVALRSSSGCRPLSLRVERILFFRKYVNRLDPVHTAELELSGSPEGLPAAPFDLSGSSGLDLFTSFEVLGTGHLHLDPI